MKQALPSRDRIVLIVLVLAFSSVSVSSAETSSSSMSSIPPFVHLADLTVPDQLGQISSLHEVPNAPPSTRLLILIQDAHVNYEAQKNLAGILDRLWREHRIRLILVEGGEGDVSLSYLRDRGDHAVREEVAERYLERGMLSGEEYLDIVSDYPLILWGVDDDALYREAMDVFLELEQDREALERQLTQFRRGVEQLRAKVTSEPLRTFEAQQALFDEEQLSFSAYLDYLFTEADRLKVSASDYPVLQRAATVTALEAAIDYEQVEAEQRQVVDRLRLQAAGDELAHLSEIGQALRAGEVKSVVFYQALERLMQRTQLDRDPSPHLDDYMRYVTLKADLASKALWSELVALQGELKQRLVGSSIEAELVSIADGVALFERLVRLQWSPDDHQAYLDHEESWRLSQWLPVLHAHAAQLGVAWSWTGDAVALDRQLRRAARFYVNAAVRETIIVRRVLEKMESEGEQAAVLVVGGFHTDRLSALLAEQRVHVAVVTPWVGREQDDRRYPAILKAKYQDRRSIRR